MQTILKQKIAEGFISEMSKLAGGEPGSPGAVGAPGSTPGGWFQAAHNWLKPKLDQATSSVTDSVTDMAMKQPGFKENLIKKYVQPEMQGLVQVGEDGKFGVNHSAIPGYLMNQAGKWLGANPGKALLGGAGIIGGGLLLHSLLSNNNEQQQQPGQSIQPQGYQPPRKTFDKFSVAQDADIRQYVLNSIYGKQ